MISPKNKIRIFEIIAVIITGIGKFIFVDWLKLKFWYVIIACTFWFVYLLIRYFKDPSLHRCWGFTKTNLKEVAMVLLPIVILSSIAFLIYGLIAETLIFNWNIIPILLLYPIWGIIQQFLIMGLIASGLQDMKNITIPKGLIVLICAVVFSMVHYPSIPLIVGTFLLAIVYSLVYLWKRNLWVLGISHGVIGCFFYFFVLGRDPWVEFFAAVI